MENPPYFGRPQLPRYLMELNYSKATKAPKDELNFTFWLNHQSNINHETIVL
jgi:hypothetical protein